MRAGNLVSCYGFDVEQRLVELHQGPILDADMAQDAAHAGNHRGEQFS